MITEFLGLPEESTSFLFFLLVDIELKIIKYVQQSECDTEHLFHAKWIEKLHDGVKFKT